MAVVNNERGDSTQVLGSRFRPRRRTSTGLHGSEQDFSDNPPAAGAPRTTTPTDGPVMRDAQKATGNSSLADIGSPSPGT